MHVSDEDGLETPGKTMHELHREDLSCVYISCIVTQSKACSLCTLNRRRPFWSAELTCSTCCHRPATFAQRCCISTFRIDLLVCEMPPLPPKVTLLVSAHLKCLWETVSTLHGAWWKFTLRQDMPVSQKPGVGSNTVASIFSSQMTT